MRRRLPLSVGWGLAAMAIALFCALGTWQLGRRAEKQAMLEAVQRVLAQRRAEPLTIAGDSKRTRSYDWVEGEGSFAAAPVVLLDNQQRDGRPGVRAYALFESARALPLLVELGWLPLPLDRTLPQVDIPPVSRVTGLLMPPPAIGMVRASVQAPSERVLLVTAVDSPELAHRLGVDRIAPRILRLDPALSIGYPRDFNILPNTLPPERHLGYAVQWFGLAAAVLATALILTFRSRRVPTHD